MRTYTLPAALAVGGLLLPLLFAWATGSGFTSPGDVPVDPPAAYDSAEDRAAFLEAL